MQHGRGGRRLSFSGATLVQRLGVGVAALAGMQRRQIVQRSCDIGMIATERLFED
jgi:hypothetical protein